MKLEDILEQWAEDTKIDRTELGRELLKLTSLHEKYLKILKMENLHLHKMQTDLKVLRHEKYEFLTTGETAETREKGWKLPARGVLLKAEANQYVDVDQDVINMTLKVGLQNEKVDTLMSIMKEIASRSWNIRGTIEWEKFKNGA